MSFGGPLKMEKQGRLHIFFAEIVALDRDHQKVAQQKKPGPFVASTLNVHHGEKILLEMLKNKMCNCSAALLLTSRHTT